MKNFSFLLTVGFIAIAMSSCSFYNPISTNIPSYEKVGEVNLGVNLGTSADVHISTNPINHLSIIGTASTSGTVSNQTGRNNNVPDSLAYSYDRTQFELGIGYYYYLTDKIQHDFHIGYGIASAAARDDIFSIEDGYAYRADVTNLFIQSSLIIELDKDVKGFISSKFNYLTISDYEESYDRFAQGLSTEDITSYNEDSFWFNQFGIGLIGDLGPLQIIAQGQLNFRFSNNLFLDERPLGLYAGINFNISEIINRSKQKE
tara:strand:- start:800 stop:1579 length:780 start_codon:yes stop_codon:yes gene_type:complete